MFSRPRSLKERCTRSMEKPSLLAEVSHGEAKMRERRESLSFLSFLPRRERPLLAGKEKPHIPASAETMSEYWFQKTGTKTTISVFQISKF